LQEAHAAISSSGWSAQNDILGLKKDWRFSLFLFDLVKVVAFHDRSESWHSPSVSRSALHTSEPYSAGVSAHGRAVIVREAHAAIRDLPEEMPRYNKSPKHRVQVPGFRVCIA